jgi:hypothetical protein
MRAGGVIGGMNTHDTTEELAHRTCDGFDVFLVWDRSDGALWVVVVDSRSGVSFELPAGNGRQGLERFYHPFAYAAAA